MKANMRYLCRMLSNITTSPQIVAPARIGKSAGIDLLEDLAYQELQEPDGVTIDRSPSSEEPAHDD